MQIYTVGKDLRLTPVSSTVNNEKLKIGESVGFFDKRRMGMNIAEVLPTQADNLIAYDRVEKDHFYKVYLYFPSMDGEETFTGKLVGKELIDNEYHVFWFKDDKNQTRIVSTSDMCVRFTRVT